MDQQNSIIKAFENDSSVVAASFNEGESLTKCQTYWTNFFLRDFLLRDPSTQSSGKYRQASTGVPFGRGFIIDPAGKVALPYFGHYPQFAIRCLKAFNRGGLICAPDSPTISQAAGGPLTLEVDGTPIRRGNAYATAITLSGTTPGTPLGGVLVPINMDGLTWAGLLLAGTPLFPDFIGYLDARGRAAPAFAPAPGFIPAPFIGLKFWMAVVTFDPAGLSTSSAVEVLIAK